MLLWYFEASAEERGVQVNLRQNRRVTLPTSSQSLIRRSGRGRPHSLRSAPRRRSTFTLSAKPFTFWYFFWGIITQFLLETIGTCLHVLGKTDEQKKAGALVLTFSRACGSQFEMTHDHKIIILGDAIIFVAYYTMQQITCRLKKNHKLQKEIVYEIFETAFKNLVFLK